MDIGVIKFCPEELIVFVPHCSDIRQWGNPYCKGTQFYWRFPISFNRLFIIVEAHQTSRAGDFKTFSILNPDNNGFTLNSSADGYVAHVIALGIN